MSKTRIIDAVRDLDLEATRSLVAATPSLLTVIDRQERNLLHLACSVPCHDLRIPETAAARMVTFLLDRGMDIEAATGPDRCTPLFFAVARGRNTAVLKLLLKRGAEVDGRRRLADAPFLIQNRDPSHGKLHPKYFSPTCGEMY